MKESWVAAEVNFISEGTPSFAWITVCTLIPPFFLPFLGWRPTPLNSRLENSVMVVESIMCSRLSHLSSLQHWLSEEMCTFTHM